LLLRCRLPLCLLAAFGFSLLEPGARHAFLFLGGQSFALRLRRSFAPFLVTTLLRRQGLATALRGLRVSLLLGDFRAPLVVAPRLLGETSLLTFFGSFFAVLLLDPRAVFAVATARLGNRFGCRFTGLGRSRGLCWRRLRLAGVDSIGGEIANLAHHGWFSYQNWHRRVRHESFACRRLRRRRRRAGPEWLFGHGRHVIGGLPRPAIQLG
jgi:hypothetical protein